jgi:hypothetical protein
VILKIVRDEATAADLFDKYNNRGKSVHPKIMYRNNLLSLVDGARLPDSSEPEIRAFKDDVFARMEEQQRRLSAIQGRFALSRAMSGFKLLCVQSVATNCVSPDGTMSLSSGKTHNANRMQQALNRRFAKLPAEEVMDAVRDMLDVSDAFVSDLEVLAATSRGFAVLTGMPFDALVMLLLAGRLPDRAQWWERALRDLAAAVLRTGFGLAEVSPRLNRFRRKEMNARASHEVYRAYAQTDSLPFLEFVEEVCVESHATAVANFRTHDFCSASSLLSALVVAEDRARLGADFERTSTYGMRAVAPPAPEGKHRIALWCLRATGREAGKRDEEGTVRAAESVAHSCQSARVTAIAKELTAAIDAI